jgi:hypothetical protein
MFYPVQLQTFYFDIFLISLLFQGNFTVYDQSDLAILIKKKFNLFQHPRLLSTNIEASTEHAFFYVCEILFEIIV